MHILGALGVSFRYLPGGYSGRSVSVCLSITKFSTNDFIYPSVRYVILCPHNHAHMSCGSSTHRSHLGWPGWVGFWALFLSFVFKYSDPLHWAFTTLTELTECTDTVFSNFQVYNYAVTNHDNPTVMGTMFSCVSLWYVSPVLICLLAQDSDHRCNI